MRYIPSLDIDYESKQRDIYLDLHALETKQLICHVIGYPNVRFGWRRNGTEEGETSDTLILKPCDHDGQELVTCTASVNNGK